MTVIDLLASLNLLDETEHIEAKRASELGKSILETICAFANEPGLGGGWLLLGVVRDDRALFPGSDEDLLQSLGCIRRNPQGDWQPTVAGLMLFGKPVALRNSTHTKVSSTNNNQRSVLQTIS